VYQSPKNPFVANFIGATNLLTGEVISATEVRCGNIVLEAKIENLEINCQIAIAIRPEAIELLDDNKQNDNLPNVLSAEIEGIEFLGSVYHLTLRPDGNAKAAVTIELSIHKARQIDLNLGTVLKIQLPAEELQIFPNRA
ncbi:MAG: TOBE domain-containing protein, partial [Pseudanabaena sp.]